MTFEEKPLQRCNSRRKDGCLKGNHAAGLNEFLTMCALGDDVTFSVTGGYINVSCGD